MSGTTPSRGDRSLTDAPELELRRVDADLARAEPTEGEFVSESVRALFGSTRRTGGWEVPDHLDISATFGDVTLDFRQAELPPSGLVQVDARAVFGNVNLVVLVGTEVEIEGQWTIFGEIGHSKGWLGLRRFLRRFVTGDAEGLEAGAPDGDPFLLRVTGSAVFGEISIKSRD